jgi:signal transduction histidine kinase
MPHWDKHPLWQELLAGGFQLLTEVNDDLLRRVTVNDDQFRLLSALQIRSLMVIPLVSRAQTNGIVTLAYTSQSGRRYGRDDPALAEEFALHAAHALQNARLMKDLKSSEARFRVAVAGARTVVFEQDRSLRYTWYYNPLTPGGVPGRTPEESLPSDEVAQLIATKRGVLERGEGVHDEVDLTLSPEERRHYREAIEPIRDRSGKVVGIIGAATDITEQQRMKQQLTEDLTFREQMMGVLGHDLRSPLNAIGMAGDLLLRRAELAPTARDQVMRIRRASGRMKEMIDTLLDFTRFRSLGKVPLNLATADLEDLARGLIDELHLTCPECRVRLELHGEVQGQWDPARISQAISNLIGNAVAYGEPGTDVTVTVDGQADDVFLSVHNYGPPISPDLRKVLFQPFRRGIEEDHSPGGLGLGLYIAQQIVLAHGGDVGVESTAQEGTTFWIRLPRVRAPEMTSPEASPPA